MKTQRTVKTILYANMMDMGGFPVRQAFPSSKAEAIGPFLLLHHANIKVPSHIPVLKAGVGPHPHRGFSPVTFIYKGGVHHRDSRGNNHVVYAGGIQWMNAGMGVIHSERPPQDIHELGGVQELIQLWVNTPAKHKMDEPVYMPLTKEEMQTIHSNDGLVSIAVASGSLHQTQSPIVTHSPVNTYMVHMQKGGKYIFPIKQSHEVFVYALHGKILVNQKDEIQANYVAVFDNDGLEIEIEALEETELLIGTGEPLNETVASHGPFVMNTQTEIMEAFRDYQMGKMGILIEE